jgi:hypothetical protein
MVVTDYFMQQRHWLSSCDGENSEQFFMTSKQTIWWRSKVESAHSSLCHSTLLPNGIKWNKWYIVTLILPSIFFLVLQLHTRAWLPLQKWMEWPKNIDSISLPDMILFRMFNFCQNLYSCSPIWYNQIPHSSKYDLRNSNIPVFCGRVRIFQYSDVFSRFSRSNMLMFFQKIRHFIHCNYLNLSERKQTFIWLFLSWTEPLTSNKSLLLGVHVTDVFFSHFTKDNRTARNLLRKI